MMDHTLAVAGVCAMVGWSTGWRPDAIVIWTMMAVLTLGIEELIRRSDNGDGGGLV